MDVGLTKAKSVHCSGGSMVYVCDRDRSPPPPWNVDDVTRAMSKGGCACECSRVGVFFNFSGGGWRHADNVQGGGGGCLWMSSLPLSGNPHDPLRRKGPSAWPSTYKRGQFIVGPVGESRGKYATLVGGTPWEEWQHWSVHVLTSLWSNPDCTGVLSRSCLMAMKTFF